MMYREDLLFSFKQIRHHTVSTFSLIQTFMLFLEFRFINRTITLKTSIWILRSVIKWVKQYSTLKLFTHCFSICQILFVVLVRVNSVNIHPLAHSLYLHKSIPHVWNNWSFTTRFAHRWCKHNRPLWTAYLY